MPDSSPACYVLPVHNAADRIGTAVALLRERFAASEVQIILVETASTDDSFSICSALADESSDDHVGMHATQSEKGMRCAYRAAIPHIDSSLTVLCADDLRLAFTDTDAYLALRLRRASPSDRKHHSSHMVVLPKRRVMT